MPFEKNTFDLLAECCDGQLMRVQSKGTLRPDITDGRYRFNINRTNTERSKAADFYAFVALDIEAVHFVPRSEIKTRGSTIWVPQTKFGVGEYDLDGLMEKLSAQGILDKALSIGHSESEDMREAA